MGLTGSELVKISAFMTSVCEVARVQHEQVTFTHEQTYRGGTLYTMRHYRGPGFVIVHRFKTALTCASTRDDRYTVRLEDGKVAEEVLTDREALTTLQVRLALEDVLA